MGPWATANRVAAPSASATATAGAATSASTAAAAATAVWRVVSMTSRKSAIRKIRFCSAKAWKILFRGEEVQMYFATRREARQMLWMLRNPVKAHAMTMAASRNSQRSFGERFGDLKYDVKFR